MLSISYIDVLSERNLFPGSSQFHDGEDLRSRLETLAVILLSPFTMATTCTLSSSKYENCFCFREGILERMVSSPGQAHLVCHAAICP